MNIVPDPHLPFVQAIIDTTSMPVKTTANCQRQHQGAAYDHDLFLVQLNSNGRRTEFGVRR